MYKIKTSLALTSIPFSVLYTSLIFILAITNKTVICERSELFMVINIYLGSFVIFKFY